MHLNLNYRMQNIFSTQKGRGYDLRHQLQANALAEVIKHSVFVEARASTGQTLIDPHQQQFSDNLSNTGNRADFYTFGVSPYWRPHWGGYAEGEFRLGYNYFTASEGEASTTHTYTQSAILQSGSRFRTLTWQFGFRNEHDERRGAANVDFRNAVGRISYRLRRKFSTFVQGGWVDNDFQSTTDNNNNGFFYTVGATWSPSRMLTIEGGYGNNLFATVILEPTRRTRLQGTYRHNDVGSLTGDVFQGSFSHRGRHTTWQGRYLEEITTTQRVLLQQQVIPVVDAAGNPIVDPATRQPLLVPIDLPALVDEVFLRKRFELNVTRNFARHSVTLRLYRSRRIYQVSKDESKVLGLSGTWRWQGGRRTTLYVRGSWQRSDTGDATINADDDGSIYWTASLRLNRRITEDLNAYVEYRHQRQNGDSDFDYRENRAIAAINMRF
ncbi:hypothetical protein MIN45_P2188 [Methylomarinovum tepidoasis]|uniref:TIGR03016 family PEP-CTERM system-associated outer membrane protein n=1 Tax=Methylomarinovum tepidoasis TaxID=2840183 RepID=A0AAU9CYL3_9GAMM|nr:TIGR03016 family PEP-CTERM system-associated outer membrane protein [Methylomarinovum sp. IN45]BCX89815.1 hypothetical protein MIN45_P2188 [Methylomarinovum sp. IN45]